MSAKSQKILPFVVLGAFALFTRCTKTDDELFHQPESTKVIATEQIFADYDALIPEQSVYYYYNSDFRLTMKTRFNNLLNVLVTETTYTYDTNGWLQKKTERNILQEGVAPPNNQTETYYSYTPDGLLQKIHLVHGKRKLLTDSLSYTTDGTLHEIHHFRDNELIWHDAYHYNRDGILLKISRKDAMNVELHHQLMGYDPNGLLTSKITVSPNNEELEAEFHHFNATREKLITEQHQNRGTKEECSKVIRYTYLEPE